MEAEERQQMGRPLLGQLAVEAGRLTRPQVLAILGLQTTLKKPFGRIAVDLGMITEQELADLLLLQSERETSLESILVESEKMSDTDLAAARKTFYLHLAETGEREE